MLIEGADYITRFIKLPARIYGMVTVDPDGVYQIYINRDLSPEAAKRTLDHELNHILRNDLYNRLPIRIVEG